MHSKISEGDAAAAAAGRAGQGMVPGKATVMTFVGCFRPASFRAFADHRACLLDLVTTWVEAAPGRMVVTVSGQEDFVDAFEMACSLGPLDCLVQEVERQDADLREAGPSETHKREYSGG